MSQPMEFCSSCTKPIMAMLMDGLVSGPYRFTIKGKDDVYCSRRCRDGFDWDALHCRVCQVPLTGMRRGTKFCSKRCAMRSNRSKLE